MEKPNYHIVTIIIRRGENMIAMYVGESIELDMHAPVFFVVVVLLRHRLVVRFNKISKRLGLFW